jgi:pimeloyl-ACP methyl ester carboxylesterase
MGGYVALAYERLYHSTLRGLMLIDTKAAADTPEARVARDGMIELARTNGSSAIAAKMMPNMLSAGTLDSRREIVAELQSIMENTPATTIQHALAAMRDRADFRATLPRINAPTLVIVGESDTLAPVAIAEEMHKSIRGSTLSVITGAGHMAPMEQPQQVSRAIRTFLKSIAS